jgi:Ca-activated chloride channel family protein
MRFRKAARRTFWRHSALLGCAWAGIVSAGQPEGRTMTLSAAVSAPNPLSALLDTILNALLALLVLALGLALGAAQAAPGLGAGLKHPADSGGGALLYRDQASGLYLPLPTLATEAEIAVGGVSARVGVVQRFKNASNDWLIGIYVFPLPEDAAVDSLRMTVGGRTIEGRVAERAEAKKEFDRARDSGRRASLVEQERPNVFTASVANIAPGEEIEVRLSYAQAVERDGAAFRLRFPMVVGPRYAPGPAEVASAAAAVPAKPEDWSRVIPPVLDPAQGPINPVEISVRLDPGFAIERVNSPFHAVKAEARADGQGDGQGRAVWRVTLAQGATPANRDFELEWFPAPAQEPLARVFAETRDGARYALLTVMPPTGAAAEANAPRLPREAIFVIDTSGSMHGESIKQARQALILALNRLKPGDLFNVIEFNDKARRLFARAEPATPEFRARALAWVARLQANGGTEMRAALDLALDGNTDPARLRQVIFLTDGAVANDAELLERVRQRLGDSRLFTVGIGSAPNGYFMRKAAEIGRGSAVFIGKPEQVAERMERLFKRLENPAVTDLAVQWPGGAADALPDPLPDLYDGEPVAVAAKLPGNAAGQVVLTGKILGKPWRRELGLNAADDAPAGIPVLWARHKVEALNDSLAAGAGADEVRRQIVAIGLAHNIVTRHTSLVAVDATPARPATADLMGGAMPTNLPQGWSYAAVFGGAALGLPQTATPAGLLLLTGALLLGLALFLLAVARERSPA